MSGGSAAVVARGFVVGDGDSDGGDGGLLELEQLRDEGSRFCAGGVGGRSGCWGREAPDLSLLDKDDNGRPVYDGSSSSRERLEVPMRALIITQSGGNPDVVGVRLARKKPVVSLT